MVDPDSQTPSGDAAYSALEADVREKFNWTARLQGRPDEKTFGGRNI